MYWEGKAWRGGPEAFWKWKSKMVARMMDIVSDLLTMVKWFI